MRSNKKLKTQKKKKSIKKTQKIVKLPFLKIIKEQRKSLGLTQKDVANLAGCGIVFVHDLENGKPTIRLNKFLDVLNVLGIRLEFVK